MLDGRVTAQKMGRALGGAAADGVLAEYTLFDEASLVHVPTHLTDEEGATLPCAAVTAWNAVVSGGRIAPGDTVVVLGTGEAHEAKVQAMSSQIKRGSWR